MAVTSWTAGEHFVLQVTAPLFGQQPQLRKTPAEVQKEHDVLIARTIVGLEQRRHEIHAQIDKATVEVFNRQAKMDSPWTWEDYSTAQVLCGELVAAIQERRAQHVAQQAALRSQSMSIADDVIMGGMDVENDAWALPWSREPGLQDYSESTRYGKEGLSRVVQIKADRRNKAWRYGTAYESRKFW